MSKTEIAQRHNFSSTGTSVKCTKRTLVTQVKTNPSVEESEANPPVIFPPFK